MTHINLWNLLAVFIIALVLGVSCHPVSANEQETDYYNHYLSEQISKERLVEMEREANEEWKSEFGDIPRKMTEDELTHARKYVEARNGTR
ncbi:hypothetical protein [Pasteurella canis]|uniref:hypothetical protein n=1 Tax=Pasteurella canis TaxID=753 RepID=UPI000D9D84D5|nr:hypothetical protein [Pasteurella canis]SPY33252.1 Uncharacterised protein [Pasteurella canis]